MSSYLIRIAGSLNFADAAQYICVQLSRNTCFDSLSLPGFPKILVKHGLYYNVMPSQNQFLSMNPALRKQTSQQNMLHYFVSLLAESSQILLKF